MLLEKGQTPYLIQENDAVIFFNFRVDRPRQLTRAFVFEDFERESTAMDLDFDPYTEKYFKKHNVHPKSGKLFTRGEKIKNLFFVTMTEYGKPIAKYAQVAFPPEVIMTPLAEVLSIKDIQQLRLAESEKEHFVTFYFDGQRELPFPGEIKRILPSPQVTTYDLKPEMAAVEITNTCLELLKENRNYRFVLINFANPDMVGHTGNLAATKSACETVDECVGKIVKLVQNLGGVVLITADHGNAEELLKRDGSIDTEHSINPVPFILVGKEYLGQGNQLQSGVLADVAPTILKIMGFAIPTEMTGRPLI